MMRRLLLAVIVCVAASGAWAIDDDKAFDDPVLQARYDKLIAEVRCVTCQNNNIKDSNAFVAKDLRREIRRMIADGMTDADVVDFLVTRYGDFILYRPRTSGKMMLLWIAPFVFLVFGLLAIVRVVRHRASLAVDDELDKTGTSK